MSDLNKLLQGYTRLKQGTLWSSQGKCKGFAASNPGEAAQIDQYVSALAAGQNPEPPVLATATGQGLVAIIDGGYYTVTPDPDPDPDPVPVPPGEYLVGFSVHLHGTFAEMDAKVARYKTAGAQVLRDDFAWAWMETSKGNINFSRVQNICEAAKKHGMKLLPQMGFCPAWANGNAGSDKIGPLNPADYASFVVRLLTWCHANYPGLLVGAEYWNEPNIGFLINPTTRVAGDPEYYVSLANAAYNAVKTAGIPIPLVGGATAGNGQGWAGTAVPGTWDEPIMQWTERVFKAGIKFDEWSSHPYEFADNATGAWMTRLTDPTGWARSLWDTRVESLAEQLARWGYTGPIHGTEWGAPTDRPDGSAAPRGTSEANQAELFKLGIPLWKSNPRHGHLTIYCADDTNSWGTSTMEEHFGAWRSDNTPKPAVAAIKAAIG